MLAVTHEPMVGQIHTIRTFRVTREGILTGLHLDDFLWSDGEDIAARGRSQRVAGRFGAHPPRIRSVDTGSRTPPPPCPKPPAPSREGWVSRLA